jgi:FAD:protein FMN transferase
MKKILSLIFLFTTLIGLSACQKPETYTFSFFEYMDTYISINVMADSENQANEFKSEIESIYQMYHVLSTGYEDLTDDSEYKQNIYTINQQNNIKLEIDEPLYDLLFEAERLKDLTDGYFDISLGEVVSIWKTVILDEDSGYLFQEIPTNVFESITTQINAIVIEQDVIELTEESGKFYIQVKSTHAKLDLGAIAKGYATQRVYEYLREQNVEYFSISAGSSSIALGQNPNREGGVYNVSLANPVRTTATDRTYGMIYVKDLSVTTSGNYEQYAIYNNLRYHHIISPMTKTPAHYYHTLTVLGDDAGVLDAISTALFSMAPEIMNAWLLEHQAEYQFEIIRYKYDGTITTNLTSTVFEENEEN